MVVGGEWHAGVEGGIPEEGGEAIRRGSPLCLPVTCSGGVPTAGGRSVVRGGAIDRAVVATDTDAVAAFVPSSMTELGETVHVAASGAPVQANDTVPLSPEGLMVNL